MGWPLWPGKDWLDYDLTQTARVNWSHPARFAECRRTRHSYRHDPRVPCRNTNRHPYTVFNPSAFDLTVASTESLASDQLKFGLAWWRMGDSGVARFWRNAYAELGAQQNESTGAWLLTGNNDDREMYYTGIRIAGGCEIIKATSNEPVILQDMCQTEFGTDLNPPGTGKLSKASSSCVHWDSDSSWSHSRRVSRTSYYTSFLSG